MNPTTTIKRLYRRLALRLYRKSIESELCTALGFPVLFTPIAPLLWKIAICIVLILGFFGWLEGVLI